MKREAGRWLLTLGLMLAPRATAAEDGILTHTERGPVRAEVRIEPEAPRIGDPLVLTIRVTAEPGVELLMPEFGEALDRFAIVDFAPREELDSEGRTLATQRYTLQASRSGPQSVPPIAIEFVDRRPGHEPAPEGEDAHELLTERVDFEVASVLPDDAALELRPPKLELGPRQRPGASRWPLGVALLVLLAASSPLGYRAWRAYRERAQRQSAYEIASAALQALLYAPRPGPRDMDSFFVQLSNIVRFYLEGRFRLHSPELTTEEFLEVMAVSPDLLPGHRRLLQDLLRRADLVKFAHHIPSPDDVEASIDAAEVFLRDTREGVDLG